MTIENQGINNETFNVIAYVNTTVIHTENIINLAGGSSKTACMHKKTEKQVTVQWIGGDSIRKLPCARACVDDVSELL
jgi:hypothetical protein